jgi:hypothetical protein
MKLYIFSKAAHRIESGLYSWRKRFFTEIQFVYLFQFILVTVVLIVQLTISADVLCWARVFIKLVSQVMPFEIWLYYDYYFGTIYIFCPQNEE